MSKRLVLVLLLGFLVAVAGSVVTAHPLENTATQRSECDALTDKKKRAACRTCFTKAGAKPVHYHHGARKKGNRCHPPEPAKKESPRSDSGGCGCG